MTRDYFWWCDGAVDGRKVRAQYELEDLSQPGIVHTDWAPSQGCSVVRWPTAGLVQRWRACTEGAGCSAWFEPQKQDATFEDVPPAPPSTTPPGTDTTPPFVTITAPANNSSLGGVINFTGHASDNVGIAELIATVNGVEYGWSYGEWIDANWDSAGYSGPAVLRLYAFDGAQNVGLASVSINVDNPPPDPTPPSIEIGGTDPNSFYQGVVPIVATASDPESGIASMTVYVNDEPIYYAPGSSVSLSWDSSGYNGQMAVKVAATNEVGNTAYKWFHINVINRPPTVNLVVPMVLSGQVFFQCDIQGVGPVTKTVLVDGVPVNQGDWGWASRSVPDGPHTVVCRGTDIVGHVGEASSSFWVYNGGGLSWIYPQFAAYTGTPSEPVLELKAIVDEADLDFAEIYETGSSTLSCSSHYPAGVHGEMTLDCDGSGQPGAGGLNILGRPDQEVNLMLHVTAHNDYQMTSGSWGYGHSFYIDNTPPVIELDHAKTRFVDVDGVTYVHLEAVTPKPASFYSPNPDAISSVEFFAHTPDGSTRSLGAVSSGYPWTLTERLPDDVYDEDGDVEVYAVATDTVLSHANTVVHRTGTSSTLELTRPLPSP